MVGSNRHFITREIGIDAGHRVTHHHSKCANLHGHRYTIQATCSGPLAGAGSSQGMVLDFGFLKEEMMAVIDTPCDHGLILWALDPLVGLLLIDAGRAAWLQEMLAAQGYALFPDSGGGKLYVTPFVPTAENLARHWFERLSQRVLTRSSAEAILTAVRVYETPNCWAEYRPAAEQENGA